MSLTSSFTRLLRLQPRTLSRGITGFKQALRPFVHWWFRRFPGLPPGQKTRARLTRQYLRGEGIEIGALHYPAHVLPHVRVRYVDLISREDARNLYPELAGFPLVHVDIIGDGETLATIPDDSQDFVVANHFLEHTEDPIGTMLTHFRVLRPGGLLFYAVPDKRHTFDLPRPVTTLAHHIKDHAEGPAISRRRHLEEFHRLVTGLTGDALAERVNDPTHGHIHFHVWTQREFLRLLDYLRDLTSFDIITVLAHDNEVVCVLRKG